MTPAAGQEPSRRVVEGEIPIGASDVALDLRSMPDRPPASIPSGAYDILVLVAGQLRRCERISI